MHAVIKYPVRCLVNKRTFDKISASAVSTFHMVYACMQAIIYIILYIITGV